LFKFSLDISDGNNYYFFFLSLCACAISEKAKEAVMQDNLPVTEQEALILAGLVYQVENLVQKDDFPEKSLFYFFGLNFFASCTHL
jgi:hypothetical protein